MEGFLGVLSLAALFAVVLALPVWAHCPLCSVGIGFLAVVASTFGVSLSVMGLFTGAFAVSTGLWVGRRIKWEFRYKAPLLALASFILTVPALSRLSNQNFYVPVFLAGAEGGLLSRVYLLDQFRTGGVIGGILIPLSMVMHAQIRKLRGKLLLPFQGVVITLAVLLLAGVALQAVS